MVSFPNDTARQHIGRRALLSRINLFLDTPDMLDEHDTLPATTVESQRSRTAFLATIGSHNMTPNSPGNSALTQIYSCSSWH
jgi:hypothetical protein